MQLRYKRRSMYNIAVLTSDSQHGPVGRIELQDAQGLVLRPFLEAAVQLELHDPRSPSRPIASLTPCSGAAPHASFCFVRRVARWQCPYAPLPAQRVVNNNSRPFLDIVYITARCDTKHHRVHPTHVRVDARASTAENVTLTPLFPLPFSRPRARADRVVCFSSETRCVCELREKRNCDNTELLEM